MKKVFKILRNEISLPIFVVLVGILIGLFHLFSYLIPFTDNAFVVTNITPVAADVSGYITAIYVKNGQHVKKNEALFKVYQEPYRLEYENAQAKYEAALEKIKLIDKETAKTRTLLNAAQFSLERVSYEYGLKNAPEVKNAVSKLEIKKLGFEKQDMLNKRDSFEAQIAVENQEVVRENKIVKSLKAAMDNAKVNLDLTIVRAPDDGIVDNMYVAIGTPIKIHEPIFSFIDTATWWVQANFNETDLRYVRAGDKVTVLLRMYYFDKIFHGVIVNSVWAANRQDTSARTQQQKISNENQWLLLPQRFPLQIKILDPDPKYPLNPGASAFVYVHTSQRY